MENKMTNKTALTYVLETYELPVDVREKLETMLDKLNQRTGASKKPSAEQLKWREEAMKIVPFLSDKGRTASDLQRAMVDSPLYYESNQRMTACLKYLIDQGLCEKSMIKGKAHFFAVNAE